MATFSSQPLDFNLEVLSDYMPGAFLWKKDLNSVYMETNAACANLFGFRRKRDISGFVDEEIPCKIAEFAEVFRQQDQRVISSGKPLKILEIHPCASEQWKVMLNTKNPLRNSGGDIVGTFAYCLDITQEMSQIATILARLGVQHYSKGKIAQGSFLLDQSGLEIELTKRQAECLFYLIRGKTFKQIAQALKVSPRTVEDHIEQLKLKFACQNKSELVETAIQQGFINVLPPNLFSQSVSQALPEKAS